MARVIERTNQDGVIGGVPASASPGAPSSGTVSALARTVQRTLAGIAVAVLALTGCAGDDIELAPDAGEASTTQAATTPVTFRSSATAGGANLTSLTIARPAGVIAGDVLIARIANRNQVAAVLTPPTGWQVLRSDQSASQLKAWVVWKVAGSAEPTSYVFRTSIASYIAGSISAFAGADPSNPIDASSGQKNGTSATLTAPAVTTSAANGLAVWLGTQIWTGSTCPNALTQPAGFTEAFDRCLVSSSQGLLFDAAYRTLGAAGTQPAWIGSSPFPNTNTAQVVTLRPAGTPACTAANSYATTFTTLGSLTSPAIVEVSGLAASRVNPGVLFAHSEDNASFVAISKTTAAVLGSYVAGVTPWDWEDVATGPCPAGSCIFMGDIGKSSGRPGPEPTTFAVYRMKEPDLAAGQTTGTIAGDRFPFKYPDAAQNAETLMVHPTTGQIYVVTKSATGLTNFYKFPTLPAPGVMSTLIKLGSITLPAGPPDASYREVTAGAIHPCSNRFVLRTYRRVLELRAPSGGTFEQAFAASPVALTDTTEGQGEALEYDADGSGYFTMTERTAQPYPLKRVNRL